ncbi:PDZ domain [Phytophthora cactorum]|nr:PDZ domain [Phytophthora cactorum]
MADPRAARGDSACSDDSAFGDETLSQDEYVQRQMDKMRSLDEAENMSFLESAPSHRSSNHSGTSELSANMTVYEKLQALALAEKIKLDDPNGGSGGISNKDGEDEDDDDEEEEDDTYEISWDGGPLGLLFKANANGQPVIRRVNKKGAATGLQYARAGDVLLALNGVSVSATPFSEVIERLKNPEFPVKLDFRPLKLSDLASAASSATSKWGLPRTGSSIHSSDATSAFCGSPVSSNATVDLRSNRGAGWGESSPTYMPQVSEAPTEDPTDVEYDVVWSVTPSVAQIAAGDILVSINGLRTEEIGFKSTVTLMMRATKPVYLDSTELQGASERQGDFPGCARRGRCAAGSKQYTVLWREGPLGIQIRTSSKGRVVVARLTGAGAPNVNDSVKPGDIFVRVAGVDVDSLGIAGAFELLKTVQKPPRTFTGRHPGLPVPAPAPAPLPSSSALPSFRQLREEEAAAAAAAGIARTHSAGYSPARPRTQSRGGSLKQFGGGYQELENYAASDDGTSLQSYDYLADSPRSSASHKNSGLLNVDSSISRMIYPTTQTYHRHAIPGTAATPVLHGRIYGVWKGKGSYLNSASFRRSMDLHNIPDDESAGDEYFGDHLERPPPGDPIIAGPTERLQELRRQYIESERQRNLLQNGSATMVSTYSDIDDSGLVVRHQRQPSGGSVPGTAPSPQLPLPELWVRWSDEGQIVVSRLTGSGYSPGLTQLRPGDWLVSFNNQSTRNLRLGETMELLKRSPKPVDMCFIVQ